LPTETQIRNAVLDMRPAAFYAGPEQVTLGSGEVVPPELVKKFNWPAAYWNLLWVLWNGDSLHKWLSVASIVLGFGTLGLSIVGFSIYLGVVGNRLALRSRPFQNIRQFLDVQHAWGSAAIGWTAVQLVTFSLASCISLLTQIH
jgi:hypothetical protein